MTQTEFSKREKEVIEHLLKGESNKQIAQNMGVSVRTVEFHLSKIYSRLEVHSRTEAIIKLNQRSLEEPASKNTSGVLGESTVARQDQRADNEGNQKQRRFPVKTILTVLLVVVSSVVYMRHSSSVVTGTETPVPISYKMENTPPPTPTPWDTPPSTPTPLRMENTPPPTPTPLRMENTPPPTSTRFKWRKTPRPTATPWDTPPPTPTPIDVTPILMCTPPPCPGNHFICDNPNGCPGGCGVTCLAPTSTPLGMEATSTPLPIP
jgi:DNA-binding CsgD family transcriptional regulator